MEMPKVSITGNSTAVVAKRFGGDIVLQKKLVDAKITETHRAAPNKRVNGKQKDTEVLTLSAADQKALRTADPAALVTAKIEHAKDKKKYIEWATNAYDKRAAEAAEKARQTRRDEMKKDADARDAREKEIRKTIRKTKQKPMSEAARKRMMTGSTNPGGNAETEKVKEKYTKLSKFVPNTFFTFPLR